MGRVAGPWAPRRRSIKKKSTEQWRGNPGGPLPPKSIAISNIKNHTFLHYNGAYHSNNYEGILWYINQEEVKTNCSTISTVNQKNVHKLDSTNTGIADYIIAVDNDMTSTY